MQPYGEGLAGLGIDPARLLIIETPDNLALLRAGPPPGLEQRCVDAMATHESMFFRDITPFEQIAATVLPELAKTRSPGQPLRIWCAAPSHWFKRTAP